MVVDRENVLESLIGMTQPGSQPETLNHEPEE